MKDAIRVRRATSGGSVRDEADSRRLTQVLELDDARVEFLEDACEQDEKILAGDLSDRRILAVAKCPSGTLFGTCTRTATTSATS